MAKPQPKPSALTPILARLLENARANPGSRFAYLLTNGAKLHMRIHAGRLHLGISRLAPVQPSAKEWEIVLAHSPQPLPEVDIPNPEASGGRWYRWASWNVEELAAIAEGM